MRIYFSSFLISTLFFCLQLFPAVTSAQSLPLHSLCALPKVLNESSGLIQQAPNYLWSHNDSGGEPKLYAFDTLGTLLRVLRVKNAVNIDWEEITKDDEGNIYVGDFGNNANIRKEMVIYKIPNPDLIKETEVVAETILFSYPEQTAFPPSAKDMHYDMEAMIYNDDSLFLFSKCRTDPFSGICRLYALPAKQGQYKALLRDSIMTATNRLFSSWITAAALSPQKDKLVLISSDHLWLFTNFKGNDFFHGRMQVFDFPMTQKEGICFADECSVYLSDELVLQQFGQKLYKGSVCNVSTTSYEPFRISIHTDTIQGTRVIRYTLPLAYTKGTLEVYSNDFKKTDRIPLKQHKGEVILKKKILKKARYLRIIAENEVSRLFLLQ